MTKSQYESIRKSEWMYSGSCDFMNFNAQMKYYLVFERIILNVAASNGIDYRLMLHAKTDSPAYVPKCIAFILIDRTFRVIFNMSEDERISLLGVSNYKIIEEYKRYKRFD
jgi:hypothetical protein